MTFRSAAPAGLPLLALYSVAAGLSDGGADWLWFLVAAAGYLLLLLAEGRDRLSQWGRVFGGAPRTRPGGRSRAGAVRPGPHRPAHRRGRAGHRPGGARSRLPAMNGGLLDAAGAGVGAGSGRRRHDLRGEPAGVAAGQPERGRGPPGAVRADQRRHRRLGPVPADRVPGRLRRHHVEAVQAVHHGRARPASPTPLGLGADVKRTEIETTHLGRRLVRAELAADAVPAQRRAHRRQLAVRAARA